LYIAKDRQEEQLTILESKNFASVNSFALSYPNLHDEIGVDYYRLYSLQVLPGGNLVGFGAYFYNQDDINDNIGNTIMFWLGNKVG
jgi:hypothetical protein